MISRSLTSWSSKLKTWSLKSLKKTLVYVGVSGSVVYLGYELYTNQIFREKCEFLVLSKVPWLQKQVSWLLPPPMMPLYNSYKCKCDEQLLHLLSQWFTLEDRKREHGISREQGIEIISRICSVNPTMLEDVYSGKYLKEVAQDSKHMDIHALKGRNKAMSIDEFSSIAVDALSASGLLNSSETVNRIQGIIDELSSSSSSSSSSKSADMSNQGNEDLAFDSVFLFVQSIIGNKYHLDLEALEQENYEIEEKKIFAYSRIEMEQDLADEKEYLSKLLKDRKFAIGEGSSKEDISDIDNEIISTKNRIQDLKQKLIQKK